VDAFWVPDVVAVRRAEWARVPAQRRRAYDGRMAEAIELVASKRRPDGLWPLETSIPA
jgi:hypothetical protein